MKKKMRVEATVDEEKRETSKGRGRTKRRKEKGKKNSGRREKGIFWKFTTECASGYENSLS